MAQVQRGGDEPDFNPAITGNSQSTMAGSSINMAGYSANMTGASANMGGYSANMSATAV